MMQTGNKIHVLFFLILYSVIELKAQDFPFSYKEYFWFDKKEAPMNIPFEVDKEYSIIYADDIKFKKGEYSFSKGNCPKNLIIFANTLRIEDVVKFNLSPNSWGLNRQSRSGGKFYIFANEIIYEFRGFLEVDVRGYNWNGRPPSDVVKGEFGGDGGQIFYVYDKVTMTEQEINAIALSQHDFWFNFFSDINKIGSPITQDFRSYLDGSINYVYSEIESKQRYKNLLTAKTTIDSSIINIMAEIQVLRMINSLKNRRTNLDFYSLGLEVFQIDKGFGWNWDWEGVNGNYKKISNVENSYDRISFSQRLTSKWMVEFLKNLRLKMNLADSQNDKVALFNLFNQYSKFTYYKIDRNFQDELSGHLEYFNTKRREILLPLEVKKMNVNNNNDVYAAREGGSIQYFLFPTNILINNFVLKEEKKLGYQYISGDEVTLYFTGKLTIDEKISQDVRDVLNVDGYQYSGLFKDTFFESIDNLNIEGFDRNESYLKTSGNNIEGKLVINTEKGYLNLLKMGQEYGIKIPIKWKYIKDNNYNGELILTLSFASRSNNDLQISTNGIFNNNKSKAILNYVINSKQKVINLNPAIEILPNSTVNLPNINSLDINYIPAEAVVFPLNIDELRHQFVAIQTDNFIKDLIIKNSLPNKLDGYEIEQLELELSYTLDGNNVIKLKINIGRHNDEKAIKIYYPSNDNMKISVSGKVKLDNGYHDIKPTIIDSRLIEIKSEMLR